MAGPSRAEALALDAAGPLAGFPARFVVADAALAYLDGHSLGRLPIAAAERLRRVVDDEWGCALVRSWEHWIDLPGVVGDTLAPLLGVGAGEVIVADSVTANLHRLVHAACDLDPGRRALVAVADDFPTDRYVVAGVARDRGLDVRWVPGRPVDGPDPEALAAAVDGDVAVVVASLVDFRSAAVLDPAPALAAARAAGALVLWDCSHAAGVLPLELGAIGDLAVGCTYKHLHGGPGAPAWLWARPDLVDRLRSPVAGWFAQRDQFAMGAEHDPLPGPRRFLAGTPGVLGLVAAHEGARLVAAAGPGPVRDRSLALGTFALALADDRLVPLGFAVASPRHAEHRGGHLALSHPDAPAVGRAARAAGVVPDVRPPDLLRLGLSPLATRFVEVWDGVDRIAALVTAGRHRQGTPGPPPRLT
ncbi:MAG: aminotransferase class V-fold PLP-dependent enzyme [Acidimicrobiales bacterium]